VHRLAYVDPDPDDEAAYREAQNACLKAIAEGRLVKSGRAKAFTLALMAEAWASLLEEFVALDDKDALPDGEAEARKVRAAKRREGKAIGELLAATRL
jgi:hypothetical protein